VQDEATSALDTESERVLQSIDGLCVTRLDCMCVQVVQAALDELLKDKSRTSIVV
jgi:hypothetical protein